MPLVQVNYTPQCQCLSAAYKSSVNQSKMTTVAIVLNLPSFCNYSGTSLMRTPSGPRMCVRNTEASVFQRLPVEFPLGVATRTRLFSTTWPLFWNSGLLRVGEKAPKALLVTSTIDISKNTA